MSKRGRSQKEGQRHKSVSLFEHVKPNVRPGDNKLMPAGSMLPPPLVTGPGTPLTSQVTSTAADSLPTTSPSLSLTTA